MGKQKSGQKIRLGDRREGAHLLPEKYLEDELNNLRSEWPSQKKTRSEIINHFCLREFTNIYKE